MWCALQRRSSTLLARTDIAAGSGSGEVHTLGGAVGLPRCWQHVPGLATDAVLVVMVLKTFRSFACLVCTVNGTVGVVRCINTRQTYGRATDARAAHETEGSVLTLLAD